VDWRPVGRDAEIAEIHAFLSDAAGAPAALEITGDIGIGKTVVWRHLLHAAGRSSRVLSCQTAPTERPPAFSALDDLFGDIAEDVLCALPGPRLRCCATRPGASARPGPAFRRPTGRCWRGGSSMCCGPCPPTRRSS
jgi:hypothetical protein